MKNNIQVLALLTTMAISTATATLYAQQNAVKYAFSGKGRLLFDYEHAINENTTILAGFQKWNLKKTTNATVPIFGLISSDKTVTKINGHRLEVLARRYNKKVFNSAFIEGGIYAGKHDITIEKTSSTTNLWAIGLFNLNEIYTSTTTKAEYKSVKVAGAKLGAGYQKILGGFNFELSGGMNINAYNAQNQRPIAALKAASPYARLAIGVAF